MSTTTDLYAPAQRHFARLEQADRQRYEAWLLASVGELSASTELCIDIRCDTI